MVLAKRLNSYEAHRGMTSESFYRQYTNGKLGDDAARIDWANDYRHYLAIRAELEQKLRNAA